MSMVQSLNQKDPLIPNPDPSPARPLAYHDRAKHIRSKELLTLQDQIKGITHILSRKSNED